MGELYAVDFHFYYMSLPHSIGSYALMLAFLRRPSQRIALFEVSKLNSHRLFFAFGDILQRTFELRKFESGA
jgi:hypothetical protein